MSQSSIEIYQTDNQKSTVWLNRHQLSELFGRDIKTIGRHVNNVFKEGELARESVVAKFATTALDGKTYQVEHYSLDEIISVGYRVKSQQGVRFRQWATQRLKEVLVQGYTINQHCFEQNAQALKQALVLIEKTAQSSELSAEAGTNIGHKKSVLTKLIKKILLPTSQIGIKRLLKVL